ncbi:uncharacterized protein LOC119646664 isoform X2 [Hermetia illucens]|uniref:uncharacterized protein LOC119646664 isoform X2 n=1 Tax=Hermetia illucens TaxID=343691 RepID=UPI0018CC17F0|nr:uncharacterized protein LOC119646664 isoform X2 [Hermetia illucens]
MKLAFLVLCAVFATVTPAIRPVRLCDLAHGRKLGGPQLIPIGKLPPVILAEIERIKAEPICATQQVVAGIRYKVKTTKCVMEFYQPAVGKLDSRIPDSCS